MKKENLKEFLDNLYIKYHKKHSSKDPVWNLHRFSDEKDIEIAGLIISCYSYGQVDQINRFVNTFFERINWKPYKFTKNYQHIKDKKLLKNLYYRFNDEKDLANLILGIQKALKNYDSLKNLFLKLYNEDEVNIIAPLNFFSNSITNNKIYYLLPNISKNSTAKRLNMYLRWMVRKDNIDLGIWGDKVSPSKLIMPVDTHIYRISQKLGLVSRKSCDMKYAIELTEKLKDFDANDPVKYDFALCHLGIDGK
ncbi:MAG: TIGR02757 family protein [Ignavibacteria bacterium]|nr:TIGR02757 family protein [Ignavibacteria bacterium]